MNKVSYLFMSLALSLCVGSMLQAISLYVYNESSKTIQVTVRVSDACWLSGQHQEELAPGAHHAFAGLTNACDWVVSIYEKEKDGVTFSFGPYGETKGIHYKGSMWASEHSAALVPDFYLS